MLRQAIITLSFSSTVPEFNGIKHKHHRVKVDPYAPLWRVRYPLVFSSHIHTHTQHTPRSRTAHGQHPPRALIQPPSS